MNSLFPWPLCTLHLKDVDTMSGKHGFTPRHNMQLYKNVSDNFFTLHQLSRNCESFGIAGKINLNFCTLVTLSHRTLLAINPHLQIIYAILGNEIMDKKLI